MKQLMLAIEVESKTGEPPFDRMDALLSDNGFSAEVDNGDGTVSLLPASIYVGEFEDDVAVPTLAELLREELETENVQILSLFIAEMGADRVLQGEPIELEGSNVA